MLPSVSTILATKPFFSVNDTLTSVLPDAVPVVSSAAVPSQTGVDTAPVILLRTLTASLKKVRLIPRQ